VTPSNNTKKNQASAYQRAGSKTREEVTSQSQTHLGFLEKKQQRVLRTEREREGERDRNRKREREMKEK